MRLAHRLSYKIRHSATVIAEWYFFSWTWK